MSEQATMTREQLEAAGYEFNTLDYVLCDGSFWYVSIGYWRYQRITYTGDPIPSFESSLQECLQAATAHYRQQQELAQLREVIRDIANELYNCGGDKITDTLPADFMADVWAGGGAPVCMDVAKIVVSVWPTVSKTERAE